MTATFPSDADTRSHLFASLTAGVLDEATRAMPRTAATPPGVASLLTEARRLLLGASVSYDNLAAAILKAFQAAELALKARLGLGADRCTLGRVLAYEKTHPVLDDYTREWYTNFVLHFRNKLSHPHESIAFTPGMALPIVEGVHAAITELFPDE